MGLDAPASQPASQSRNSTAAVLSLLTLVPVAALWRDDVELEREGAGASRFDNATSGPFSGG